MPLVQLAGSLCHVAHTICRRMECACVRLNYVETLWCNADTLRNLKKTGRPFALDISSMLLHYSGRLTSSLRYLTAKGQLPK